MGEEPEYMKNFLSQFLDETEEKIQYEEQQKAMREKLNMLRKDAGTGLPKSILKKKDMDAQAIQMPAHMSKAHRAPIQIEGNPEPHLTEEQEARLTSEQITEGVNKARDAMNAPTHDLLEFEKQLKAKHDEYKEKGIVPKLQTDSQTI